MRFFYYSVFFVLGFLRGLPLITRGLVALCILYRLAIANRHSAAACRCRLADMVSS
ncbi:hypothetical protein [Helicobacter pylori]|uniref:hypothetical protein n=1 Tax=Helicobacter pylori TaxID=210 RepID=UPI00165C3AE0|nr:hypothetical protein [Helicobacter pylori]